jgi:hypothetical protein
MLLRSCKHGSGGYVGHDWVCTDVMHPNSTGVVHGTLVGWWFWCVQGGRGTPEVPGRRKFRLAYHGQLSIISLLL